MTVTEAVPSTGAVRTRSPEGRVERMYMEGGKGRKGRKVRKGRKGRKVGKAERAGR